MAYCLDLVDTLDSIRFRLSSENTWLICENPDILETNYLISDDKQQLIDLKVEDLQIEINGNQYNVNSTEMDATDMNVLFYEISEI